MINTLVVPLDGAERSSRAVPTAAVLTRPGGADIRLVGMPNVALRVVTVYEPVPVDLRQPDHFTRLHGPPRDPTVHLGTCQRRLNGSGVTGVEVAAIPDPVSVADRLASFLEDCPPRLLVVGGRHTGPHVLPGVLRELLRTTRSPARVVPSTRPGHGGPHG